MSKKVKTLTKRGLTLLVCFAMIATMLSGITVFAGAGLVGSDPAVIEFIPMKYTQALQDAYDQYQPTLGSLPMYGTDIENYASFVQGAAIEPGTRPEVSAEDVSQSKEFILGIKIRDMDNITEASDGLRIFTIPLIYDPQYIEITTVKDNWVSQTNKLLNNQSIYNSTFSTGKGTGTYSFNTGSAYDSSGFKSIPITATAMENPSLRGDDFYILILKYKYLKVPEDGAKIITLSMDDPQMMTTYASYFTVTFNDGSQTSYQPDASSSEDIRKLFTVDATAINVPAVYKVEFIGDGTVEGASTVKHTVEGIKEDNPHLTTVQIGEADAKITSPTADGKYFAGWYTKDGSSGGDYGDKVSDQTDIAKLYTEQGGSDNTVKLYSKWEQGKTVTVHKHYPEGASDITDPDKGDITLYADPTTGKLAQSEIYKLDGMKTPSGYALAGWATTEKNTTDFTNDQLANHEFSSPTNDLYAVWSEMITINFYDNYNHGENDGKGHLEKSITMEPNSTIQGSSQEAPTPPSRDQYTFKEWNTKQNGSGTTITQGDLNEHEFSESTDLFAIWTAAGGDTVTLTFDAVIDDAKSTVKPESITVNKGDTVYKAQITDDPTVDNYTFAGWFKDPAANTDAEVKFDSGYQANDSETLYAHWTYSGSNPAKVTFMAEGATGVGGDNKYTEVTVEKGTSLGNMMPTEPSKEGSKFKEWNEGESGDGAKFDKDTTVSGDKTVYAQWTDKITVTYDLNGGSAVPNIDDVSGLPDETFNLTTTTPTKSTYDFIGWNTKQNGSGVDIEDKNDGEDWTFETLSEKAGDEFQGGKVTLYAQWGYVLGPHTGDGVTVTFDSNANGNALTEANPKEKAVEFSTSIGEGNMPDPPTRDGYTFKEWNTKQNGSGNKVDENYTFTQETDDPDNDGKMTVYAQWTVTSPDDEITISFDTNGGDGQATPPSMTIKKGDALSALPDEPTRENYKFVKWAKGKTESDTAVEVGSPTFDNSETVYAIWERTLRFDIGYTNPEGDWNKYNQTEYDGTNQAPDHIEIYDITNVDAEQKQTDVSKNVTSEFSGQYTLKYYLTTQDEGDATTDAPKDVGEYKVVVELTGGDPYTKVSITNPGTLKVVPQGVTVKVTETTQDAKVSSSEDNAPEPTIKAEDASGSDFTDIDVKYYKWENPDNNLTSVTSVASDATDASALKVGWYVVKVTSTDPNYEIKKVEGKTYPADSGTAALPDYAGAKMGENIYFRVILNDPKANSLKVTDPNSGDELDLKDDDYTTPKPFDPEEKTDTDYYVRADKDTDAVDVEVDAGSDYDVTVEFGGQPVDKGPDGKYHIEGLEGAKEGSSNDVKVTVKPKGASEPVQTYTVHVQRLVEAKIVLNYGNSPYGEIMKDTAIVDKEAAKAAFNVNNRYDTNYLPSNAADKKSFTYATRAWTDINNPGAITPEESAQIENPEVNMDRNDYAIFVYNDRDGFVDPGFTATDSLGNPVETLNRKITVNRMTVSQVQGIMDANQQEEVINIPNEGSNYLITQVVKQYNVSDIENTRRIRPDIYYIEYSFTDDCGETCTVKRPMIVLQSRGDTNFINLINDSSANPIYTYLKTPSTYNGVTGSAKRIYFYRELDIETTNLINDSDANPIFAYLKISTPLDQLYVELPSTKD